MSRLSRLLPLPAATLLAAIGLAGCQRMPPMPTVAQVDLERFMGDWYVIANIPTWIERGAHNAVESYRLDADGTIATTFRFRKGGFDGPIKIHRPRGFVRDHDTNALWGMQFLWPIKADYRIVHLSDDYAYTIIARQRRDYVWIMARTPELTATHYRELVDRVAQLGYDPARIERVPQRWPEPEQDHGAR